MASITLSNGANGLKPRRYNSHTHTHTYTYTYTQPHIPTLTHAHNQAHTREHTHTRTYTLHKLYSHSHLHMHKTHKHMHLQADIFLPLFFGWSQSFGKAPSGGSTTVTRFLAFLCNQASFEVSKLFAICNWDDVIAIVEIAVVTNIFKNSKNSAKEKKHTLLLKNGFDTHLD